MDKIGFVILHYLGKKETVDCIESIIEKIDTNNYEIIIVDNASPDKSGKDLLEIYKQRENIHFIFNEKNEGFSKGNNIGYKFAKKELECNYIVLSNNDIVLLEGCFYKQLKYDFEKYNAAVVGPRIYTYKDSKGTQNPCGEIYKDDHESLKKLSRKIVDLKIANILSYLGVDLIFLNTKHLIGKAIKQKKGVDLAHYENIHKNVKLHGCFWAFTPMYVYKYEGIEEVTFMYHEEFLLSRKMIIDKQIVIYDPKLKIFHAEKVATKKISNSKRKSRRIRYERELQSIYDVKSYLSK